MSRSRAIETRLEKLIPSLDEYFSSGFLSREEVVGISRQRTHWEYRLVAKPLLLLDVQHAIQFELQLEERLKQYCTASKLSLRHRWTVLERIETIYRIGLKNLRKASEKEVIRKECIHFLRKFGRTATLARLYGEWMILYPTRHDIWIEGVEWTAFEDNNMTNARALVHQALLTMAAEPSIWACAMKIELHMVVRLLRGLIEDHRKEVNAKRKENLSSIEEFNFGGIAETLRLENATTASIVLDLALAKAVAEEALQGPASSPDLVRQLLVVASSCPVAAELVAWLCKEGVALCSDALREGHGSQKKQKLWEAAAGSLLWDSLSIDHRLVNHGHHELTVPTAFLKNAGAPSIPTSTKRAHAAGVTLLSLSAIVREASQFSKDHHNLQLPTALSTGVKSVLRYLLRCETPSSTVSALSSLLLKLPVDSSTVETDIVQLISKELLIPGECDVKKRLSSVKVAFHDYFVSAVAPVHSKMRRDNESFTFWSVNNFSEFATSFTDVGTPGPALYHSSTLDEETVHRFLLWWNDHEKTNSRATQEEAVIDLLKHFKIVASTKKSAASPSLLMIRNQVTFTEGKTPVNLWKLFNALECLRGKTDDVAAVGPPSKGASSSSDSDSDSDDGETTSSHFSSYAAAGLRFIASASRGLLSPPQEFVLVEGVCSLICSRFTSLTGLSSPFKREALQRVIRHKGAKWVEEVKGFIKEAHRCLPIPRHAQVAVLLPFYEALTLESSGSASAARAAYEELLSLYSLSKHLSQYAPLVYDGKKADSVAERSAQAQSVHAINTQDWLAFADFERYVARDLVKSQQVVERARRLCLAPQLFLIENNSFGRHLPPSELLISSANS